MSRANINIHHRDYSREHPDRKITIQRGDGIANRIPNHHNAGGWEQYHLHDPQSVRWRGVVGTLIATMCGIDSKKSIPSTLIHHSLVQNIPASDDQTWHLSDWVKFTELWL